jgi:hypothetical protein
MVHRIRQNGHATRVKSRSLSKLTFGVSPNIQWNITGNGSITYQSGKSAFDSRNTNTSRPRTLILDLLTSYTTVISDRCRSYGDRRGKRTGVPSLKSRILYNKLKFLAVTAMMGLPATAVLP